MNKKEIRTAFRNVVFKRDENRCVVYKKDVKLGAHHITDRNEIVNGGYVVENGISLCVDCHIMAEKYHVTGIAPEGWHPDDLYCKIGSSKELAIRESEKL